jgi:rhodanese-related sulfurtransferase
MAFYTRGEEPPRDVDFDALNRRALEVYAAHQAQAWIVAVISATSALKQLAIAVQSADEALLTTYNFYGDEADGGPFFGEIQANGFIWPMQELEKYYKRIGDEQRAQAIRATLTQVVGEEEPAIMCVLTEPLAIGELTPAPVIVDVRGKGEYAAGHAQGAVNIPLDTLTDRLGELPSDTPIVTYCNMNHPGHSRGERAAALLSERGFAASAIAGGLPAWQAAGLSVATGVDPQ